jgi:hypothetical protein
MSAEKSEFSSSVSAEPESSVHVEETHEKIELSSTVGRHLKKLSSEMSGVSAKNFINEILGTHSDYASGVTRPDLTDTSLDTKKPAEEWVSDALTLLDETKVSRLHGRLFIICMAIQSPDLKQLLDHNDFLSKLSNEIKEKPLDSILSEKGKKIWLEINSKTIFKSDSVANLDDDALLKIDKDQLGRAAFARFLVKRLTTIEIKGAFAIHIYAPWGAGKTTLLNFMQTELEQKDYLVVNFNAWSNQHINSPWWSLMDRVFFTAVEKRFLEGWDIFKEYLWRAMATGAAYYFIGAIILISFLAIFNDGNASETKNLTNTITAIITILTAGVGISRLFSMRSAEAAKSYMASEGDPMGKMSERFENLVGRIKTKKVAIFIDDLDRCQSQYVVELLEGIQTLFRKPNVIFVVAADQHWLNACFEQEYEKLKPYIYEPGQPLGTKFLAKLFQFSTPVLGMSPEVTEKFWGSLLKIENKEDKAEEIEAIQNAKSKMSKMKTEKETLEFIKGMAGSSFAIEQAVREEGTVQLADPKLIENIEKHTLSAFAPLLEPNPRAMKRLVNAYSINSALSILGRLDISPNDLALWTILSMRWPELAELLEESPHDIEKINPDAEYDKENPISKLFSDTEVINVINAKGVHAECSKLDIESISKFRLLRC